MSKHLAKKGAYFYTHVWNRTFGEALGLYPPHKNATPQRYKRAGVFIKSMLKDMKNQNVGTIYRGLQVNQARNFEKNGQMTRKTFSSFSRNYPTAHRFAHGDVILQIDGRVPAIRYNNVRYKSVYPEKEILLPPGTFTFDKSRPKIMKDGVFIYHVKFTPTEIKVNIPTTKLNTSERNNMNNRWRYMKIKNLNDHIAAVASNINRVSKMRNNEKDPKRKNTLNTMLSKLYAQANVLRRRQNRLTTKRERNVPSYNNI